jgi:hypothetical protein
MLDNSASRILGADLVIDLHRWDFRRAMARPGILPVRIQTRTRSRIGSAGQRHQVQDPERNGIKKVGWNHIVRERISNQALRPTATSGRGNDGRVTHKRRRTPRIENGPDCHRAAQTWMLRDAWFIWACMTRNPEVYPIFKSCPENESVQLILPAVAVQHWTSPSRGRTPESGASL